MIDFQDPTFWVAVGFLLLVVGLFKPIKKVVLGALDDRAEKIRQNLDEAASLREEAQQLLAEYQRKQRDAVKETENLIARAQAEADRLAREGAQKLEDTLKRRELLAVEKLAQAEEEAVREVRLMAIKLAVEATRSLIAERLNEDRSSSLVDEAIAELSEKLH